MNFQQVREHNDMLRKIEALEKATAELTARLDALADTAQPKRPGRPRKNPIETE